MFCTKCGNEIPGNVMFCTYCGAPVKQPAGQNGGQGGQQGQSGQNGQPGQGGQYGSQGGRGGQGGQPGRPGQGGQGGQYGGQPGRPGQGGQYGQGGRGGQPGQAAQYGNRGPQGRPQGGAGPNMGWQPGQNGGYGGAGMQPRPASLGKGGKIALAIALITALLGLGVYIFFTFVWTPTVDLDKYVTIESSGYNTIGTATATFDINKFSEDYGTKIKAKGKAADDADDFENAAVYMYQMYITGSLDKSTGLSNGDQIKYQWTINEDGITDKFKVKLKYSEISYQVSDLQVAETFDVFEKVSLVFEGVSPNGSVTVRNNNDIYPVSNWYFEADKTEGLSIGDKVTVSIENGEELTKECLEETGKIPAALSKEYEVTGLSSRITKLDQIPADMLDKMKRQVEDKLNSSAASSWDDDVRLEKMTYMGSYLLSEKEGADADYSNIIVLVYAVDTSVNTKTDDGKFSGKYGYYYYGSFYDMTLLDDGTASIDLNYIGTPDNSVSPYPDTPGWPGEADFRFQGYQNIDTLFNKVVTANIDKYEYESNVDTSISAVTSTGKSEKKKVSSGGDVFPDSSSRYLSPSEVSGLSEDAIQTAINEIYARHGYKFKDKDILAYFEQFDWYDPDTTSQDVAKGRFNSIENDNLQLLEKYR